MPEGYISRWVLPDPVDPPDTICFQINVPNEVHHLAAFYGAIYALTYSKNWQRDAGHTAAQASRVWTKIFDSLIAGNCAVPARPLQGIEQEDFMPLRVDCDCNVFVTCCDGTEMQILNATQVQALINAQPGVGAEQPSPGGGCATYTGLMGAGGQWYLPTQLSTGDTIEFLSWDGVTNDGGNIAWRTATGGLFLAGADTGITTTESGDPLNTVPHLKMIASIDGTFYDVFPGPFTVPSGISNASVAFQVNDDPIAGNSGQISFKVKICNNQAGPWSHTFDFTTSPHGWQQLNGIYAPIGVWTPGIGWVDSDGLSAASAGYRGVIINLPSISPAFSITGAQINFDYHPGSFASSADGVDVDALAGATSNIQINVLHGALPSADNQFQSGSAAFSGIDQLQIFLIASSTSSGTGGLSGSCAVKSLTINGVGPEPTWS